MAQIKYKNSAGNFVAITPDMIGAATSDEATYNQLSIIGKYPGRDLTTILKDEIGSGTVWTALHNRIQNANFKGLRVGDYVDVSLASGYTAVTSSSSIRFLIAHIDPYYQCADTAKGHHIAFVASQTIPVSSSYATMKNGSYVPWNTTSTNQGTSSDPHPYTCSNLKKWETAFEGYLPTALSQYILTQRVLLEERYSSSGSLTDSNSWSWADIGKIWSLSETEVYGQCVWGTKGWSVGFDCQFDLFKDTAHRLNGNRVHWWRRSVGSGSSSDVCCVDCYGGADCNAATYAWVRPRVGFLLG